MQFHPDNGFVFLIDKPLEWTSFDVVNKLRYALLKQWHAQEKDPLESKRRVKVGHAGTLDPLATGLLIVCAGKETGNIDQYMATEKEYTGTIFLGETTPSYDRECEPDNHFATNHIQEADIVATAKQFIGDYMQVPPIYSAIKKDGKKMYDAAREGKPIIPDPRPVTIHDFEITGIEMPLVHFRVVCSKGTYIRSLAFDFGKALHSGAVLHALRRTRSGLFSVNDAMTIEQCLQKIQSSPII